MFGKIVDVGQMDRDRYGRTVGIVTMDDSKVLKVGPDRLRHPVGDQRLPDRVVGADLFWEAV